MYGLHTVDILLLAALPALLALSAFFSGSETALFSLTTHHRMQLERLPSLGGRTIEALLAQTRALLITLLLGNTLTHVLYLTITTLLLIRLHTVHDLHGVWAAGLGVAGLLLLVLLGEVFPKLVAHQWCVAWSRSAALPLYVLHRVITPLRWVLHHLVVTPLARLIAPGTEPGQLSPTDMEALLEQSERHGIIRPEEEEMLQGVLGLSQLKVRDLMTPRVDIRGYDLNSPIQQLHDLVRETRLTYLPVYRGDLDHIEGVVHSRQVLLAQPTQPRQLQVLFRELAFVPELVRADRLLDTFRRTGQVFAIAVDEFGGTAGLVTLEDVVEEMVGDIAGPFESEGQPVIAPLGQGRWRVSAQLAIDEWAQAFGLDLSAGGLTTLGGLVMSTLGRLPGEGDHVEIGNVRIEVERMRGLRVESLIVSLQAPAPATQPATAEVTP